MVRLAWLCLFCPAWGGKGKSDGARYGSVMVAGYGWRLDMVEGGGVWLCDG